MMRRSARPSASRAYARTLRELNPASRLGDGSRASKIVRSVYPGGIRHPLVSSKLSAPLSLCVRTDCACLGRSADEAVAKGRCGARRDLARCAHRFGGARHVGDNIASNLSRRARLQREQARRDCWLINCYLGVTHEL